MKVALYARVSTERQAERGTIGSQLAAAARARSASGRARAGRRVRRRRAFRCSAGPARPGRAARRRRGAACSSRYGACRRTGWPAPTPTRCWSSTSWPGYGVTVHFTDAPDLSADDPQAVLLTQVQGVIAEYEKAKIAERYRRGKLFRARAGEITTWRTPYGYRRVAAQRGHRAGALGDLRTRGRRGAPHLHRPCRRH